MTPRADSESEIHEVIRFASGELVLEGRLCYPESGAVRGAVAFAGPHPMLGGDMDNNVVRELSAGLARRGVAVLGFNYRGVGASEGAPPDVTAGLAQLLGGNLPQVPPAPPSRFWATSHTADEDRYADDYRAAAAELADLVGAERPLALVGYSFGCSLLTAPIVAAECPLVLVAPTIGRHDYSPLTAVPNPVLAVAPDGDFAADGDAVTEWFDTLSGPKRLIRGDWDGHFFRGHEERLVETVFAFLRDRWEVHE